MRLLKKKLFRKKKSKKLNKGQIVYPHTSYWYIGLV